MPDSIKNIHSKIVLDYSFCNSSNTWNYVGVITIILFIAVLMSYFKYQQRKKISRHYKNDYTWLYIFLLILLALIFVVPFMCWLLTLVEILVTFIRYGQITASPLPMLSLPIRFLAFIYTKIISAIHIYLTAPGTFIFLLLFMIFTCIKFIILITVRFGLPALFLCLWIGLAVPLYALSEVGSIDSWVDLAFCCQLPLFIIIKFGRLLLLKLSILWIFFFMIFLIGFHIKFGLTLFLVCKCLLYVVLVRFTYVIGKGFVTFVFGVTMAPNASRNSDDVQ